MIEVEGKLFRVRDSQPRVALRSASKPFVSLRWHGNPALTPQNLTQHDIYYLQDPPQSLAASIRGKSSSDLMLCHPNAGGFFNQNHVLAHGLLLCQDGIAILTVK